MNGQEVRSGLTDLWQKTGVEKPMHYATLTNIVHESWIGLSVREHKDFKGLKKQNLRNHMTSEGLVFFYLAELSRKNVSEKTQASGFEQHKVAAQIGGKVSKQALDIFEKQTQVISPKKNLNRRLSVNKKKKLSEQI